MMDLRIGILVFLIAQQYAEGHTRIDPLVDTKVGLIRGLRASDGNYAMFMGIPFGKVDEANPFGAATPYPPFEDVFEAYDDSAICPQMDIISKSIAGSLDCLHLNVYVPSTAHSKNRLPVLVWIYGGAFNVGFSGRTLYGPKYLVRHDVILVTLNYRVGPYGFMCLDTPEIPGNQGLKDQLLALKWIKENIEAFGGDVNKITIMGESAGGQSVGLHLLTKQDNLYNSAIMQSGNQFLSLIREPDYDAPLKIAAQLGLYTNDTSDAISFLTKADPHLVIAAAYIMGDFYVCVEKEFEGVEAFLTDYPFNLHVPKGKTMPVLIGVNADEYVSYLGTQKDEFFDTWDGISESLKLLFDFDESRLNDMEEIIKHFYIGDEKISSDVKTKLIEFGSDLYFAYPGERTIDNLIESGTEKIFYYVFSYVGDRNWVRWADNVTIGGAAHADEIGYLFDISLLTDQPSSEDQLIVDRMTKLWTNFVKYGDPTPETSDLLPVKWEPITSKSSPRYYLNIDTELAVNKRPFNERMAFWDLFYRMNKNFEKGAQL